uniref:Uncharacterized protein n=1 Tax=Anguilla anguilla TaxID=7936 RepID=A0A0E9UJU8_ANGAN
MACLLYTVSRDHSSMHCQFAYFIDSGILNEGNVVKMLLSHFQ